VRLSCLTSARGRLSVSGTARLNPSLVGGKQLLDPGQRDPASARGIRIRGPGVDRIRRHRGHLVCASSADVNEVAVQKVMGGPGTRFGGATSTGAWRPSGARALIIARS
jgi:hypothetical protein